MAQCVYHPRYPAVEQCEVCHVPLCGQCLWYAESGERLCERCARSWQKAGRVVLPPEQFAEGIAPTLDTPASRPQPADLHKGNNVDLIGFAAACMGGMMLIYCVPCVNVLAPLLGLIFGLFALVEAERSVNPGRTRTLAGIGIAGGAMVILGGLFWIIISFFMPLFVLLIEAISNTP